MQKGWFTAGAVWEAVSAVGVDKTEHGGSAVPPGFRADGDRLVAGRRADSCDPLFPFTRVLRFLIGVEQQITADGAAPMLCTQEPQPGGVQRELPVASPGRPYNRITEASDTPERLWMTSPPEDLQPKLAGLDGCNSAALRGCDIGPLSSRGG